MPTPRSASRGGRLPRQPGLGRRGVEQQRAGLHGLQQPLLAQGHLLHHLAVGQHRDDDVTSLGQRCGCVAGARFASQQLRQGLGGAGPRILQPQPMTGTCQVPGHRRAHHAQADKADVHRGLHGVS
jgi:hypothetical protein